MKPVTLSGVLACASLLAPVSAGHWHDRTAYVYLLRPLAGSSSQGSSSSSSSNHVASPGSGTGPQINAASSLSQSAQQPQSYTPSDANALMSSFLRIEEYEELRDGLEVPEQLAFKPLEDSHDMSYSSDSYTIPNLSPRPLMLIAEDMSTIGLKGLFSSIEQSSLATRLAHGFKVTSAPATAAWLDLLHTYRNRLAEKFGFTIRDTSAISSSAKRAMLPPLPGSISSDMASMPEFVDDVFAPYMRSLQALVAVQDEQTLEQEGEDIAVVELKGLKDVASKYGAASDELRKASEMLSLAAESVMSSYPGRILLVTLPARVKHASHKQKHRRSEPSSSIAFSTRAKKHSYHRRDDVSSSAAAERGMPIVPTSHQCYESEATCSNTTSACYGHGQCVQGRKVGNAPAGECWVCQCANTIENGRTRYWNGGMCQKEDISSPFFLIVGSVFLLVFISVTSVALLASIGGEGLPSTLAALGGSSGHRKHD